MQFDIFHSSSICQFAFNDNSAITQRNITIFFLLYVIFADKEETEKKWFKFLFKHFDVCAILSHGQITTANDDVTY